jgi:hypothetical protein
MSTPSFLDSRGAWTIVVGRGGVTVIGAVFVDDVIEVRAVS